MLFCLPHYILNCRTCSGHFVQPLQLQWVCQAQAWLAFMQHAVLAHAHLRGWFAGVMLTLCIVLCCRELLRRRFRL